MCRFWWLVLCVVAAGCGSPSVDSGQSQQTAQPTTGATSGGSDRVVRAIATVGMVADLVRNVGGEHVQVTQICGAGVDPHLYKATRDDVQAIMVADIVFYSGLMLEGKMTDTLVKMARTRPVIAVTEEIDEARLLEPQDLAGHFDPHVWMDVTAWSECVDVVAKSLCDLDPQHADDFVRHAASYRQDLAALDEYGRGVVGSVPAEKRVLVTSHDAFNYFGRAYGMEVQGVQGLSTESEAGLQRINELVDLLVRQKVPAVFVESSVPRRSIEALVEGAESRGHSLVIGGELFSDAMGEAGTYEGTYIGMLDHNFTKVARALGGQAPERGFSGRLAMDGAASRSGAEDQQ